MLAWMCLGGLAAAASQQEALDYLDQWGALSGSSTELQFRYSLTLLRTDLDSEANLQQVQADMERLQAECSQTPVWPKDAGLADAVTAQVDYAVQFYGQTLPSMLSLANAAEPRDADQRQFETLLNLSEVGRQSHWERVDVAMRSFGADHRIRIGDIEDYPIPPDLDVELPGEPSDLSKSWRLSFAVGHHNEALKRYERKVAVWDQAVVVDTPEQLADLRPELLAVTELASAFPPWMGDETLSHAIAQSNTDLLALWESLGTLLVLQQRNILFRRHRLEQTALLAGIQDEAYKMDGAFERRVKRFRKRWHFQEYEDYAGILEQWVQDQGGAR